MIFVAGALVAVVATAVIVPHYAPGGGSPFAGRYEAVGGSPAGIVETAFTHPLRLLEAATEQRDLSYLLDLLAPLGGLPLLAPLARGERAARARAEPPLRHADAVVDPLPLHGRRDPRARRRRRARSGPGAAAAGPRSWPALGRGLVVLVLVVGHRRSGRSRSGGTCPFGSKLATRDHVVTAHDRAAARVLRAVPAGVAVSATNTLGAHLSERRRIFSFPVLREARWVAVDLTRPSYLDDARGKRFAAAYARLPAGPALAGRPGGGRRRRARSRRVRRLDRDRLRQQVGAEAEAGHRRDGVLLRGGERHRPGQVPDREVRRRHEHEAGREAEPRPPPGGLARRARRARRAGPRPRAPSARSSGSPSCSSRCGIA